MILMTVIDATEIVQFWVTYLSFRQSVGVPTTSTPILKSYSHRTNWTELVSLFWFSHKNGQIEYEHHFHFQIHTAALRNQFYSLITDICQFVVAFEW